MNIVSFPCINLQLEMQKKFNLFGIDIYWYGVIIVLALIIALFLCKKDDGKYGIKFADIVDLGIFLIPISIISARVYYVIFNLQYYLSNPMQIFNLRAGGLAIYGAIIGGAITCYIFCKKRKISLLNLLDYIIPFVALGQALGRWGNFINAEAYGIATNVPWRMGLFENGIYKEVHPTFLYESIASSIIFLILYKNRHKRQHKGELVVCYLLMYSFVRFFIEGLRIDSLMLFNFRVSQILSLLIFAISCCILSYFVVSDKKK